MSDTTPDTTPAKATPAEASSSKTSSDKATGNPDGERHNGRKVREGVVVSTKMDRTAVVEITTRTRHRRYNKTMQRANRLFVHDPEESLRDGDRVRVQETRPLSKRKRWRILEVLERAR